MMSYKIRFIAASGRCLNSSFGVAGSVRKPLLVTKRLRTGICGFCSSISKSSPTKSPLEELTIPMPWGHVAAKRWGNPHGKPILGLHGWLDNANTMNGLAPLLPLEDFQLVAIDFPGHGLSSHYPPGMTYKLSDYFSVVRRVLHELGWQRCSILSHSLGCAIASWYAAIFPDEVDRLILMDLVNVVPVPLGKQFKATRKSITESIRIVDQLALKNDPPTYKFEDAVGRAFTANQLINGLDSITRSSVETLMRRGLVQVGEKNGEKLYTWRADLRLRIPSPFTPLVEQVAHYAENVVCPLLLIKASDSPWYMSQEIAQRLIKVYTNFNPHFELKEVEGGHHIHLNEPDKVAPIITKFLVRKFRGNDPHGKEESLPFDLL